MLSLAEKRRMHQRFMDRSSQGEYVENESELYRSEIVTNSGGKWFCLAIFCPIYWPGGNLPEVNRRSRFWILTSRILRLCWLSRGDVHTQLHIYYGERLFGSQKRHVFYIPVYGSCLGLRFSPEGCVWCRKLQVTRTRKETKGKNNYFSAEFSQ